MCKFSETDIDNILEANTNILRLEMLNSQTDCYLRFLLKTNVFFRMVLLSTCKSTQNHEAICLSSIVVFEPTRCGKCSSLPHQVTQTFIEIV